MIQTLLETMKRGQEAARLRRTERGLANPPASGVSETEKIYGTIEQGLKSHFGTQKSSSDDVNFFEATESIAKELNAIESQYSKWRKSVLEKISSFGAIGFCQNFGSYVLGFRFANDTPPQNDFHLYSKHRFRPLGAANDWYWVPKKTSGKHKEIMLMKFDLDLCYQRAIGFRKTKSYKGERPKIQRIGQAWVVSFRGEIEIMGDHKRLKKFVPKGCNRINAYRLERLKRGF